jgi:hypothetical protein
MNPDPPDPFRENADLVRAFEDVPPRGDVPMPDSVRFSVERVRREALARRRTGGWATTFKIAAAVAILAGSALFFLPRSTATARVTIVSPGDVVPETTPVVAWNSKDRPEQRYDVWILPGEGDHLTVPAVFVAQNVTSPVPITTALTAGQSYRVLVCLAGIGRTAGTPVPFRVAKN